MRDSGLFGRDAPWFTAVAAGVLFVFLVIPLSGSDPLDLAVYRAAGMALLDGHPQLYSPEFGQETGTLLPFTYPPVAAVLAIPLSLLPPVVGYVAWTLAGAALLAGYVWRHASGLVWAPATGLALIIVIGFWLLPVTETLILGQLGIFLTLACLFGSTSRHPAAAVLIGLFAAIKLTPLLFLAYFALTGQWKRVGWASGGFVGLSLVGFLVLPDESRRYFTELIIDSGRIGDPAGYSNQSLAGVLDQAGATGGLLWLVVAISTALVGLLVARRWYLRGSAVGAAVAVGITTVLVSPISWQHHAVWIVPALIFLLGVGRSRLVRVGCLVVLVVSLLRLPHWLSGLGPNALTIPLSHSITLVSIGLLVLLYLAQRERT